ncbi:hypothetical protein L596_013772 [Steinernema carpocapsae]|uniref:Fe2OG dioxygenase domain-containing protein n=1 Tax=Steinernema carpocapsae TaxID=34508 RepID=A0A4U5P1M9_STECR|nr:hypothetical protein L596_013772 [Steinernema carpocapsae]
MILKRTLPILCVLDLIYGVSGYEEASGEMPEGWTENIEGCEGARSPNSVFNEYRCYHAHMYFVPFKIEVLNINPPLLIFHKLFSAKHCKEFLEMTKEKQLETVTVQDNEKSDQTSKTRVANGSWVDHFENPIAEATYLKIQSRINVIDFSEAEKFQVLQYFPGGHYAPHYDYLEYLDEYWQTRGNRIATFLAIMKTAEGGGGTVFPHMGITIQPHPGDAILWYNMDPSGEKAFNSLHGACPILKGEKLGATLWVRVYGQEFISLCPLEKGKPYDYRNIVKPVKRWLDPYLLKAFPIGV